METAEQIAVMVPRKKRVLRVLKFVGLGLLVCALFASSTVAISEWRENRRLKALEDLRDTAHELALNQFAREAGLFYYGILLASFPTDAEETALRSFDAPSALAQMHLRQANHTKAVNTFLQAAHAPEYSVLTMELIRWATIGEAVLYVNEAALTALDAGNYAGTEVLFKLRERLWQIQGVLGEGLEQRLPGVEPQGS